MTPTCLLLGVLACYEAAAFLSGGRIPTISHVQWTIYLRHRWYRWLTLAVLVVAWFVAGGGVLLAVGLGLLWWHWFQGFGVTVWGYSL